MTKFVFILVVFSLITMKLGVVTSAGVLTIKYKHRMVDNNVSNVARNIWKIMTITRKLTNEEKTTTFMLKTVVVSSGLCRHDNMFDHQ